MKRLIDCGLVKSEPAPRSKGAYRGPERYYELTDAGSDVVGPRLELLEDGGAERSDEECRKEIEMARLCLQ
jgi:DNA-binding PadR family transcriptional regulator